MTRDRPQSPGGGDRVLPAAPRRADGDAQSAGQVLFRSRTGRLFWLTLVARIGASALHTRWPASPLLEALTAVAGLGLALVSAVLLLRLAAVAHRRLLWRVRRKLILSYVFIGVVPIVLLVAFFLFASALMFLHVSAYLFKRGLDDLIDETRVVAETTAVELARVGTRAAPSVLERRIENAALRYPGLSLAVVAGPGAVSADRPASRMAAAGPWHHGEPPAVLPAWLPPSGFEGLLARPPTTGTGQPTVIVRAVRLVDRTVPPVAVVVDLPIDPGVETWLREQTGITLTGVGILSLGERPAPGAGHPQPPVVAATSPRADQRDPWTLASLTFFDYTDWETGQTGALSMGILVPVRDIYRRLLAAQSRLGQLTLGEVFLIVLAVVAGLFLVIEAAALVMGFALARSITGAIHELFLGTQRVRRGDFTHRIAVRTQDQLGELADSFNQMTASIDLLLRQAEEKRRLEEELRIAREIQMSLLPRGPVRRDGLAVTGVCRPARQVGGDYYDFFHLDEDRLGLLIADVSGKGTSAALYMAELKGLLLSLSRVHHSPRQLLVEVNDIIADNLDSRSFITMTYGVLDLRRRALTYARAGHTPLVHARADTSGTWRVEAHAPSGMVVGLRLDGSASRFGDLLHECTLPLAAGDLVILYTDGVTEAMNEEADLFGEQRLLDLVARSAHLPCELLEQRILEQVEAFSGGAEQHDDLTLVIVKLLDGWPAGGTGLPG